MNDFRDFDIKQLHDDIQSCFQYLDKKIKPKILNSQIKLIQQLQISVVYRAMNVQLILRSNYFKKNNVVSINVEWLQHQLATLQLLKNLIRPCILQDFSRANELKELQHHVKQLQQKYDEVCHKYMQLLTQYQRIKISLKLQQEENDNQSEIIKEMKLMHLAQPEVLQIPVYEYLREFTKNNHSQLSNFLQISMYTKKLDLTMIELLQNIEKYYRPQSKLLFQDKYVYPKQPLRKIRERILKTLPNQTISQNLVPERSISFQ